MERLQKILAAAGCGSRRSCEELITQGRVSVDGQVVSELGAKADPHTQLVECDGERVRPARKVYYLLNKPKGVVCTNADPAGRRRAIDLLPHHAQRLFTVGRLDADSEGLLIVTNDGDFAQRISHPRHGMTKTYDARVRGAMGNETRQKLLDGVWIDGHCCRPVRVKILKRRSRETVLRIMMQEGRNREVRRMLSRVGHRVLGLRRIRIGPLEDPGLRVGRCRKLRPDEVAALLDVSSADPGPRPRGRRAHGSRGSSKGRR